MKKFETVATIPGSLKWDDAIKREKKEEEKSGYHYKRTEFDVDYTRIINSRGYRRMKGKTQVFYAPENDHICTRIEHVNLVESISHEIASFLGLNIDLTRAISVAHDIGHSPFGHAGERVLSELTQRDLGKRFWHEQNGVNFVDNIELLEDSTGKKKNINLTYAVRDGIISHCGEVDENALFPREVAIPLSTYQVPNQYSPFTWEGCVVKISDKISYIGRDMEDAKKMGLLKEKDLEKLNSITDKIHIINTNIINYFINDLCENSSVKKGLCFSHEAFELMRELKQFNYKNIYFNDVLKPSMRYFKVVINEVYYILREQFDERYTIRNLKRLKRYYPVLSEEFVGWLSDYAETGSRDYEKYNNKIIYNLSSFDDYSRAIIDYLSGMTDKYIIARYNEIIGF